MTGRIALLYSDVGERVSKFRMSEDGHPWTFWSAVASEARHRFGIFYALRHKRGGHRLIEWGYSIFMRVFFRRDLLLFPCSSTPRRFMAPTVCICCAGKITPATANARNPNVCLT